MNKTKRIKQLLSLMLLLIAMLMPQGVWADEFITEVKISANQDKEEAKKQLLKYDYKVLDKDLNGGGGGWYVYIGYKTSTNTDNAITDLLIVESGGGFQCCAINASCMYNGIMYYHCVCPDIPVSDCNLNRGRGTGTPDIALYCTWAGKKDDGGTPITSINVVERTDVPDVEYVRHWKYGEDMNKTTNADVYGNTNMGGNATAHYITVTKHTHKLVYSTFNGYLHKITCEGDAHCHYGTDYKNHDLGTEEYFSHDATCQKGSLYYKKCKVCGGNGAEYEVGKPLGHDLITHEATEPTCSADGNILYYTCSRSCCADMYYIKDKSVLVAITENSTIKNKLPHEFNDKGVCVNNASHYEKPAMSDDAQYDYFAQEWYGFDYLIANYGNLCWFRDEANSGKTIRGKLTADIDLSGMPWATSIGEVKAFDGIFDGQGHTITGNACKALFCVLAAGGTVKNVVAVGGSSKDNYENANYQSPFVRRNYGTIENCIVKSAYWDSRSSYLGGITGVNEDGGIVRNCGFHDSTLRLRNGANTQVGGIVGVNCSNGLVENCFTWGVNYYNIGSLGSGGIVCENRAGATVRNCYTNVATPVFNQLGTATSMTSGISAAFITTGEMCYKLNAGITNGTQQWYQKIGTETFPTPAVRNTANTVYQIANLKCDKKTVSTTTFSYFNNSSAQRVVDGHGLSGYTPTYAWSGTHAAPTCTFTLKCDLCKSNVVSNQGLTTSKVEANHVDAKCAEPGNERWTATGSYSKAGDAPYNGDAQVWDYAIPALSHNYGAAVWSWAGDGYSATCTITCSRDANHTTSASVTLGNGITSVKLSDPTSCAEKGKTRYSATATVEGTQYSDTKEKADIALPHTFATGDESQSKCTVCNHGFFRYTADAKVEPKANSLQNAQGQNIYDSENHTFANMVGVMEFKEPLAIIGEEAFSNCSSFTGSLTIPNTVTSVEKRAFYYCNGFTGDLTIPNSVTSIGYAAFCNGVAFKGKLTMSNRITRIADAAFSGCYYLYGDIKLPKTLTYLGLNAFGVCYTLSSVEMQSVPQIGENGAFYQVDGPKTVVLSDDSYVYTGSNPDFPTVASVTYTRKNIKNQWGTIIVPFDVENGNDYDFYTLSNVSGDELTLTKVDGTLNAGTPALIRINSELVSGKAYDLTLTAAHNTVNGQCEINGTPADGITLTGSYDVKDITNDDGYIISNNKFWRIQDIKGGNNVYCAPFRAYLKASGSAPTPTRAKALNISIADENVTAVETLNAIAEGEAEYYDLNGRRTGSLQKGVNIVKYGNGKTKKVVIK